MNSGFLVCSAVAMLALASAGARTARGDQRTPASTKAVTGEAVLLTGECVFFDGGQPGAAAHFAAGVLVVTADALRIHAGTGNGPATLILPFSEMEGAALRRYGGERQVQIRTSAGVVVIEMTGRAGQPDTDGLMSKLRAHRVPFWDSGRFYRKG